MCVDSVPVVVQRSLSLRPARHAKPISLKAQELASFAKYFPNEAKLLRKHNEIRPRKNNNNTKKKKKKKKHQNTKHTLTTCEQFHLLDNTIHCVYVLFDRPTHTLRASSRTYRVDHRGRAQRRAFRSQNCPQQKQDSRMQCRSCTSSGPNRPASSSTSSQSASQSASHRPNPCRSERDSMPSFVTSESLFEPVPTLP
jgi:hypothetical protein